MAGHSKGNRPYLNQWWPSFWSIYALLGPGDLSNPEGNGYNELEIKMKIKSQPQVVGFLEYWYHNPVPYGSQKLEQLEFLHSHPTASWLPIVLSHIGFKRRRSQSYKFKHILKQTLHSTHLLMLLDKMCKYEMDPMRIVEDTEQTRFCPQMDRRMDGRTDGQGETSIPPFNFIEAMV